MARPPAGLSLMEMLVALALVSMMAVLLLQGSTFLYGNYQRVASYQERFQSRLLPLGWYRASIGHLVVSEDDEFAFRGGEESFSGFSLAPLHGDDGALAAVGWRIEQSAEGAALWYSQQGHRDMKILEWPGAAGRFSYGTREGAYVARWPQGDEQGDEDEQEYFLPTAIRLEIEGRTLERQEILSSVNMRQRPRLDIRGQL